MGLLSRIHKLPRRYMVAEFDVVGLLISDDGEDVLEVSAPMSPAKAALLAELVGDAEIGVTLTVAVYPKRATS